MRAAPIPDDEVPQGARRIVMAGPDGDLTWFAAGVGGL